jgi:Tat protein secretion system quality control protein TatD with DNase activity
VSHWSDAHCHLQEQFLGDEETSVKLSDTLARAHAGGVDRLVVIGTDATTSTQAL